MLCSSKLNLHYVFFFNKGNKNTSYLLKKSFTDFTDFCKCWNTRKLQFPFSDWFSVLTNSWIIQFREFQNCDYSLLLHHDRAKFLHCIYCAIFLFWVQLGHRYMSSVYIWSYPKCSAQRLIASHIYAYVWRRIDRLVNWSEKLNDSLSNTCAYSCRERVRRLPAVVVSPEEGLGHWRDKLCVQGRLLGGEGETGLEHVSWHLLTQELTPDHC